MAGQPGALVSAVAEQKTTPVASPLAYRTSHLLMASALRAMFRFEVSGRSNVPRGSSYIVVANHLNWLDAFALLLALPKEPQLQLVGWDTIFDSPRLARLIRTTRVGFIPIHRDRIKRSLRRPETGRTLQQSLNSGFPVVLFPEGQVGCDEGVVMPFRPGFARLARVTGMPILPVALSGTRNLWLRKKILVAIGSPIDPRGMELRTLVERTHKAMVGVMPEHRAFRGLKLFERRLTRLIPSLTNWTAADL